MQQGKQCTSKYFFHQPARPDKLLSMLSIASFFFVRPESGIRRLCTIVARKRTLFQRILSQPGVCASSIEHRTCVNLRQVLATFDTVYLGSCSAGDPWLRNVTGSRKCFEHMAVNGGVCLLPPFPSIKIIGFLCCVTSLGVLIGKGGLHGYTLKRRGSLFHQIASCHAFSLKRGNFCPNLLVILLEIET